MPDIQRNLFSYAKRSGMRRTAIYQKLKEKWEKSELNSPYSYGLTGFLIREFIEKLKLSGRSTVKHEEWLQYYLESGENRVAASKNNNSIETDLYFGRNLNSLMEIAEKFSNDLDEPYDIQLIFNFLVSETADAEYRRWLNITKICRYLRKEHESCFFRISSSHDYLTSEVDLLIFERKTIVGAVKILPPGKNKRNLKAADKQKHRIFEELNEVPVRYLSVDNKGVPINSSTLFR